MSWYPHVTVATVVRRDDRFLMVYEQADEGKVFNQPAGHLEKNESLQQAAVRETLEETAWKVRLTGFLGISRYVAPANNITYIRASFVAEPIAEQKGQPLDDGIIEARWMTLDELSNQKHLLRSPLVLSDIERAIIGHVYPLDLAGN